jgi:hypothetical protein
MKTFAANLLLKLQVIAKAPKQKTAPTVNVGAVLNKQIY